MTINEILSNFVFWDEILNDAQTEFTTDSVHYLKCGYC